MPLDTTGLFAGNPVLKGKLWIEMMMVYKKP
jgi:hypothetical protein